MSREFEAKHEPYRIVCPECETEWSTHYLPGECPECSASVSVRTIRKTKAPPKDYVFP